MPIVLVAAVALSGLGIGQAVPAAAVDGEDLWSGTVTVAGALSYPYEGNTGPRTFTLEMEFAFTFVDNVGTVKVSYLSEDRFTGTIPTEHACITTLITEKTEIGGVTVPAELIPPSFQDDGSGNWAARAFSEGSFQTEVTETWVAVPDTLCEPSGSRTFTREWLIGAQPFGSPAGLAHQYGHENPADSTAVSLEGLSFTEAVGGLEFDLGFPWCLLNSCAFVTWDLFTSCDGKFTVATSDADLGVPGDDLSVFQFETSIRWCSTSTDVTVNSVQAEGNVVADPLVATAFEVLGFTVRYNQLSQDIDVRDAGPGASVEARGIFESCFSPAVLLTTVGLGLGAKVIGKLGSTWLAAVKRGAPADEVALLVRAHVGRELDEYIAKLRAQLPDRIDAILRKLPQQFRNLVGDGVADHVIDIIQISARAAIDRTITAALNQLQAMLLAGIKVPAKLADEVLDQAVQDAVSESLGASCLPLWTPDMTVTLNPGGAAPGVVDSGWSNPALNVTTYIRLHAD